MLSRIKVKLHNWRWQILAKITKGEKVKFLPKLQLSLHLNRDWLVDFIIDRKGIFQPEIIHAIDLEITEIQAQLFMDIGAYNGQMGLYVKKHYPKIAVCLIEPQAVLAERIKQNAKLNKLDVRLFELALGSTEKVIELAEPIYPKDEYGKLNPGAVSFSNSQSANSKSNIQVVRLDNLLEKHFIKSQLENILLKIDVENAEWEILKGMEGLFNHCKTISIIVELNFSTQPEKQNSFDKWLDQYQISIRPINSNNLQKPYQGDFLLRWKKV